VDDLDYEAELCVVIGTGAGAFPRPRTGACRGLHLRQTMSRHALRNSSRAISGCGARALTRSVRFGPWIVSADVIPDPQALAVRCRVDGILRQNGSSSDMIFDVATLISYISDAFTAGARRSHPSPGHRQGVRDGQTPSPWLQPGQLCEVEIPEIGVIANRIVAEVTAR